MERLYSHPGKPLEDHLKRVLDTGMACLEDKGQLHLPLPFTDTRTLLTYVLLFHDVGKMTPFFQDYLFKRKGYEALKHKGLTGHGLISALIAAYQVFRYFDSHPDRMLYTILAFVMVRKHHGNLENLEDIVRVNRDDWKLVDRQLPSCDPTFFRTHFPGTVEIFDYCFADLKACYDEMADFKWDIVDGSSIDTYLTMNFLYSILLFSDKQEAIFSRKGICINRRIPVDIVDRFKQKQFSPDGSSLSGVRDAVYRDIERSIGQIGDGERIFSINVPTGGGKTLSALNAALKLRGDDQKRIIYCLPFTSVIDQNADVFTRIFSMDFSPVSSDLLVTHHHLVENRWFDRENEYAGDEAEFLIETWNSECVVTTFWQFFHTLFTGKNAHLKKFHNMAGSVIILDEIQAVPARYWTLLNRVLKRFVHLFNCKVLLVTATMPMIFSEAQKEIVELVPQKETYFKNLNRIKLTVDRERKDIGTFAGELKGVIQPDRRYLIVLNTIRSSLEIYRELREFKPLYLSTNIVPLHRLERIHYIRQRNRGDVLVSTQLVEAGVDIDFDVVYRDNAPLDCINQGAGRCNRENRGDRHGDVVVVYLTQNGKLVSSYIYDQLLLTATGDILGEFGDQPILEECFFGISKGYFDRVSKIISSQSSRELLERIRRLGYGDAFTGSDAFQLIRESFERENVFVQVDEEARGLWSRFREITAIGDRWERKTEFSKIKARFSQYVISISCETLKRNLPPVDGGFYFIPYSQLDEYYDLETGFRVDSGPVIW